MKSIGTLLVVLFCGCFYGCTTPVGSRLDQEPGKVSLGNSSPNAISTTGDTHTATAAGATGRTTVDSDGKLESLFGGVPLGSLSLPLPAGRGVLNTNGDISIKAKRLSTGGDGPTVIDELEIASNKSAVQATLGPLYQQLVPLWTSMSADQRAQVVESTNKIVDGAGDAFAKALDAAIKAFVPVP